MTDEQKCKALVPYYGAKLNYRKTGSYVGFRVCVPCFNVQVNLCLCLKRQSFLAHPSSSTSKLGLRDLQSIFRTLNHRKSVHSDGLQAFPSSFSFTPFAPLLQHYLLLYFPTNRSVNCVILVQTDMRVIPTLSFTFSPI